MKTKPSYQILGFKVNKSSVLKPELLQDSMILAWLEAANSRAGIAPGFELKLQIMDSLGLRELIVYGEAYLANECPCDTPVSRHSFCKRVRGGSPKKR